MHSTESAARRTTIDCTTATSDRGKDIRDIRNNGNDDNDDDSGGVGGIGTTAALREDHTHTHTERERQAKSPFPSSCHSHSLSLSLVFVCEECRVFRVAHRSRAAAAVVSTYWTIRTVAITTTGAITTTRRSWHRHRHRRPLVVRRPFCSAGTSTNRGCRQPLRTCPPLLWQRPHQDVASSLATIPAWQPAIAGNQPRVVFLPPQFHLPTSNHQHHHQQQQPHLPLRLGLQRHLLLLRNNNNSSNNNRIGCL